MHSVLNRRPSGLGTMNERRGSFVSNVGDLYGIRTRRYSVAATQNKEYKANLPEDSKSSDQLLCLAQTGKVQYLGNKNGKSLDVLDFNSTYADHIESPAPPRNIGDSLGDKNKMNNLVVTDAWLTQTISPYRKPNFLTVADTVFTASCAKIFKSPARSIEPRAYLDNSNFDLKRLENIYNSNLESVQINKCKPVLSLSKWSLNHTDGCDGTHHDKRYNAGVTRG